jgi:hypothetical protein
VSLSAQLENTSTLPTTSVLSVNQDAETVTMAPNVLPAQPLNSSKLMVPVSMLVLLANSTRMESV